jgi:arylsulfatase A-like enzyme
MVVLFGDHGENMTEHDSWFDHAGLYDSVVHVPLILWAPGRIPAITTSAMVQLVDVLPTVFEVFGFDEPYGIDGRSLMPLIRGEVDSHRDKVFLSEATWQAARGIRTEQWKLIKYLQPTLYGRDGIELYKLDDDPTEQVNLVDEEPDIALKMESQLDNWVQDQLDG